MQSLGFRLAAKTLQIQHEAHTARETTGQKDFESHEMHRYVEVISLDIRICCGRFVGPSHTANGWSPCSGKNYCMVAGFSATPHTHTPLSEGRKSFVPAGRSRNWLINSNVYQNIHCVGESAKLHAPHEVAQKTGTKDLQDEQDVCRHRRQAEAAKLSGDHRQKWEGHR